jgi:hypothetical protein
MQEAPGFPAQKYSRLSVARAYRPAHPLVELADMIDRPAIGRVASEPFQPGPGRPILRESLMSGG